jgi:hypothetical protein
MKTGKLHRLQEQAFLGAEIPNHHGCVDADRGRDRPHRRSGITVLGEHDLRGSGDRGSGDGALAAGLASLSTGALAPAHTASRMMSDAIGALALNSPAAPRAMIHAPKPWLSARIPGRAW